MMELSDQRFFPSYEARLLLIMDNPGVDLGLKEAMLVRFDHLLLAIA